jgi:hypothetical protein
MSLGHAHMRWSTCVPSPHSPSVFRSTQRTAPNSRLAGVIPICFIQVLSPLLIIDRLALSMTLTNSITFGWAQCKRAYILYLCRWLLKLVNALSVRVMSHWARPCPTDNLDMLEFFFRIHTVLYRYMPVLATCTLLDRYQSKYINLMYICYYLTDMAQLESIWFIEFLAMQDPNRPLVLE